MAHMTLEQIDAKIRDLLAQAKLWKKLRRKRIAEQELIAQIQTQPSTDTAS